ncbi:DinB family protein [Oceanirhabdus seepicola]|uniref:DinB family protein n=1 Tax=Oceanirhabdus seepicola TaxID=2828781 RepID=A0A9J6P5Z7_9CLOT|nr:DinB family protein [Oceanirhabdus seepicola]
MENKRELWNLNQKKLREIILKKGRFNEAIKLCLEQHRMVHAYKMSQSKDKTFDDLLWEDLDEEIFRTITNKKGRTIAYGMWHSARIEDITMSILVADSQQVINSDNWLERINSKICDTGNAMTSEEILDFSKEINMKALREYKIAVGRRTQEIIKNLKSEDMKRKTSKEGLKRVLQEGAVLDVEGANWLIDFWGKKNVAGLILMPGTRHHIVHINESLEAKKKSLKKKK